MYYTKQMFGRELKKRVLEQQDVVEIGIWAHSAYWEHIENLEPGLRKIMLDINTMELDDQWAISYKMLNKIADALIAGKDVDLNLAEYRDDNTTYYTKNYTSHVINNKIKCMAELYHEVIGGDVYFKLKAKVVDMATNNEVTIFKIGFIIGIEFSFLDPDALNDNWIYCKNVSSFQFPSLKCTTRSELFIYATVRFVFDDKDKDRLTMKLTINNPQPKGGEIDPITNAVKIISPIRNTIFFQNQDV